MYGHKIVFLIGWIWFAFWTLLASFCPRDGLILFCTARALQGIGPALLVPSAIALMGRTFPVGPRRNVAFACFGASGPLGAAIGAVLAAALSEYASWVWNFRLLALLCVLMVPLSYFGIPSEQPQRRRGREERLGVAARRAAQEAGSSSSKSSGSSGDDGSSRSAPAFDWLGTATGVTGLVLVNFALNQAPLVSWGTPYIPTLLAAGVLSLVAFVWVELRWAAHPLIPVRGLHAGAVFTLVCVFAGWSSHGIWAYYLYLLLEHLRGHSPLLAAAEAAPAAASGVLFALSTVWLLPRVPVAWVMLAAMTLFVVGSLLLALVPLDQPYYIQTFLSVILMPGAMNLSFPSATVLLSSVLPKEKQGIAASLVATVVNYSISCGLGMAGSIHRSVVEKEARRLGIPNEPLSVSTPEIVAARLQGLRAAYWFAVGLGGVGVLVAAVFCLSRGKLKGHEEGVKLRY